MLGASLLEVWGEDFKPSEKMKVKKPKRKKMKHGGTHDGNASARREKMMYGGMSKKKMMGGGMPKQQMMGGGRTMYGHGGIAALEKKCRSMANVSQSSLGRPLTDRTA